MNGLQVFLLLLTRPFHLNFKFFVVKQMSKMFAGNLIVSEGRYWSKERMQYFF